jgi:antitoxin (DNA-binding transcriptional repressor) of toxin-antitoxin stability system
MEYRRVTPKNVVHISIAEAASNFTSLLARVRVGSAEFIIEEQGHAVAVLSPVEPHDRPEQE